MRHPRLLPLSLRVLPDDFDDEGPVRCLPGLFPERASIQGNITVKTG
jgi:hypothetical protein